MQKDYANLDYKELRAVIHTIYSDESTSELDKRMAEAKAVYPGLIWVGPVSEAKLFEDQKFQEAYKRELEAKARKILGDRYKPGMTVAGEFHLPLRKAIEEYFSEYGIAESFVAEFKLYVGIRHFDADQAALFKLTWC